MNKNDYTKLIMIISIIQFELQTRSITSNIDNLNFSEFFNDIFIVNENLRNTLKKCLLSEENSLDDDFLIILVEIQDKILNIINLNYEFTNKWHSSYTLWLQSFKNHRLNQDLLRSGDSHSFINYQVLFPSSSELIKHIEDLKYNINLINGDLEFNKRNLIHNMINDKNLKKTSFFTKLKNLFN